MSQVPSTSLFIYLSSSLRLCLLHRGWGPSLDQINSRSLKQSRRGAIVIEAICPFIGAAEVTIRWESVSEEIGRKEGPSRSEHDSNFRLILYNRVSRSH